VNKDIRDAFFDEIYELASKDKDVFFISADADAFSLKKFKRDMPEQFINVGVAEQNMALVASGLALAGKKVFIYSITSFVSMRCFEQIKANICSMNLPVYIVGLGAGYSFSYDGPTHHATQDIAIMRTLPEVSILNPCDDVSSRAAARACYNKNGPVYVRIDKGAHEKIHDEQSCIEGVKETSSVSDIKIFSTGYATHMALDVARNLNFDVDVIDICRIKPLNEKKILDIIKETRLIFTLEENTIIGGLGSALCEMVVDNNVTAKMKRFALQDKQEFEFGSRQWLINNGGLEKEKIIKTIKEIKGDL
jgi:transketolase